LGTNDGYTGAHKPHGNGAPNEIRVRYRSSYEPQQETVIKGGGYLCSADFCANFAPQRGSRKKIDLPTSHVGFRTVRSN
jgi:sulfatase modifying factor 1